MTDQDKRAPRDKPRVSIVLPTYNRRDVLQRALASVRAQTFEDWELVVVDDGSTDGTRESLSGLDPRVRLIVQRHQGVGAARNTGLEASAGDLIAFLDSDDEWTPHHLALASAFFDVHPEEHVLTSEFWEDSGARRYLKHFRVETSEWYPAIARRIGSSAFERPAPGGDPLLWYYDSKCKVGAWAARALMHTVYQDAWHYRGSLFRHLRWGWLMALQSTVITRHAMEQVGPIDTSYPVASDFGYMAELCRRFGTNFLSVPACIKHELGIGERRLREGHLASGKTSTAFHMDVLRFHEELFWKANPRDRELSALRGFRQHLVGQAALGNGQCRLARYYLEQAARSYPTEGTGLLWFSRLAPDGALATTIVRGWRTGTALARRLQNAVGAPGAQ